MENKYHIVKKTLLEMEKLLVTSNFCFSHNVFHGYISLGCQIRVLCGNGLTHYKTGQNWNKLQMTFRSAFNTFSNTPFGAADDKWSVAIKGF